MAVEQGRSLSEVLPQVAAGLRPGVQALSFQVLRHLGAARAVASLLARRPPAPPAQALLHTALALLIGDGQGSDYPPHTLVDQAIEAAKRDRATRMQSGFLNACLRRYLGNRRRCWTRPGANLPRSGTIRAGGSSACSVIILRTGKPSWRPTTGRGRCSCG